MEAQTSDSELVELRVPSEEQLIQISEDEQYFYAETKKELSLWDRFMIWIRSILGDWVQSKYVKIFLKITAGITFALVLFLFLNQISKGELKNALSKRQDRSVIPLTFSAINEQTEHLDELLSDAIKKKNYTLAVRFLYQKSIQILIKNELISWKADKTNHDLLTELGNHPASNAFNRLTYYYEYVDYGDFKIDESRFHKIEADFLQFKNTVGEA